MATTIPEQFEGPTWLTPAKVNVIKDWYVRSLGDSDKASEVDAEAFYTGQHEAFRAVLILLHTIDLDEAADKIDGDLEVTSSPENKE